MYHCLNHFHLWKSDINVGPYLKSNNWYKIPLSVVKKKSQQGHHNSLMLEQSNQQAIMHVTVTIFQICIYFYNRLLRPICKLL